MLAVLRSPRTHSIGKTAFKAQLIFLLVFAGIMLNTVLYPPQEIHPALRIFGIVAASVWIFAGWTFLSIVSPDKVIITRAEFSKLHPIRYNGYVYLILGSDGLYKIGRTNNVARRVHELRKAGDKGLHLIHVLRAVDMIEAELWLHKRFADKRIRGEWFALEPADVAFIQSLAGSD